MRFLIEVRALQAAIGAAVRLATPSAPGKTDHLRIEAGGEAVEIAATNFDVWERREAAAEIEADGVALAPAREMAAAVRTLPEGAQAVVEVDLERGVLVIACDRRRVRLPVLDARHWPEPAAVDGGASFAVGGDRLAEACAFVAPAMCKEEARAQLVGARIEGDAGGVALIATDGFVLRLCRLDGSAADGPIAATLPAPLVNRLARLSGGEFEVRVTENLARVARPGAVLIARLVDLPFPDYRRVIPGGCDCALEGPREALSSAVERVGQFCATNKSQPRAALALAWSPSREVLALANEAKNALGDANLARAVEIVGGIDGQGGVDRVVGFDPGFLASALSTLEGARARIELGATAQAPVVIAEPEEDRARRVRVIMPMRIGGFDWSDALVAEALGDWDGAAVGAPAAGSRG